MIESEIRYYKGKFKVEVVLKSKGNWRVKALERIRLDQKFGSYEMSSIVVPDQEFTTVPRLLWRHPRN